MGCWASRWIPTLRQTTGSTSSGPPRPGPTSVCRGSRSWAISSTWLLKKSCLTFHTDRSSTNHEAGSLAFGPGGELYISTGDNTNPFESNGFNPIDERPGRAIFDAQRSAGNTNDLRGKILRIKPQPDGTYEIPAGNLFPADGSAGRPEIYVMGNRNPFRISIDAETGWLYWGEVGPDAQQRQRQPRPARIRRNQPGPASRQLRLAVHHRRQQALPRFQFRHGSVRAGVQSGRAGKQLAEQHGCR